MRNCNKIIDVNTACSNEYTPCTYVNIISKMNPFMTCRDDTVGIYPNVRTEFNVLHTD